MHVSVESSFSNLCVTLGIQMRVLNTGTTNFLFMPSPTRIILISTSYALVRYWSVRVVSVSHSQRTSYLSRYLPCLNTRTRDQENGIKVFVSRPSATASSSLIERTLRRPHQHQCRDAYENDRCSDVDVRYRYSVERPHLPKHDVGELGVGIRDVLDES
jgi:hypothetical protein